MQQYSKLSFEYYLLIQRVHKRKALSLITRYIPKLLEAASSCGLGINRQVSRKISFIYQGVFQARAALLNKLQPR